jgi:hypothetical protein
VGSHMSSISREFNNLPASVSCCSRDRTSSTRSAFYRGNHALSCLVCMAHPHTYLADLTEVANILEQGDFSCDLLHAKAKPGLVHAKGALHSLEDQRLHRVTTEAGGRPFGPRSELCRQ